MKVVTMNSKSKDNIISYPRQYKIYNKPSEKIILDEPFSSIIGESYRMKKLLYRAQKASKTPTTVLITGESGTGKELVAKAIHNNSHRKEKNFVAINCGAIPKDLIESELFGHEKGAFTGALEKKIGKFEYANEGTIFLDEIGDLPYSMQSKLLRVIQEKEIERVGSNKKISIDARLLAATNKDLLDMVKKGQFREDLYYRLNVIPLELSPLRDRKEDIPVLIDYFNKKIAKKLYLNLAVFTDDAKEYLQNYSWPGNVRELENVMERLIVLSQGVEIDVIDLPQNILEEYRGGKLYNSDRLLINCNGENDIATWEEYEKDIIKAALLRYRSFNAAGKALGITHSTVANKARKYNIVL